MIAPVLYQSIENDGTEGGFNENFPDIFGCGIFKCGRDHEKLKNPFILSIAHKGHGDKSHANGKAECFHETG